MKSLNWFILGLFVLAVFSRLLPHPANFSPIAAIALIAGRELKNRSWAYFLPLGILFVSDLFLGLSWLNIFVYAGFLATVAISRHSKIILATLSSSLLFFVVSNFGVWAVAGYYPRSIAGLLECYAMAIPFLHRSMLGDFFYVGIFLGALTLYRQGAKCQIISSKY